MDFFSLYCIQHCFICRPSDSTVSEDAGSNPRLLQLWHWQSDALTARLDLIHTKLDLIHQMLLEVQSWTGILRDFSAEKSPFWPIVDVCGFVEHLYSEIAVILYMLSLLQISLHI